MVIATSLMEMRPKFESLSVENEKTQAVAMMLIGFALLYVDFPDWKADLANFPVPHQQLFYAE